MKEFALRKPVIFSLLTTYVFFVLMAIAFFPGTLLSGLPYGRDIGQFIGKVGVAIVFIVVLRQFEWLELGGISSSGTWKHWLLTVVLLAVAALSTTYAVTGGIELTLSDPTGYFWITANMLGSGLAEEIVCRGLVFTCLLLAWRDKRFGAVWSGIVSAAIFGYAHMVWVLLGKDFTLGFLQSTAAFCSGVFYAGLVIQTKSVWPAVMIHGLTNALVYLRVSEILNFNETIAGNTIDVVYSLPMVIYGVYFLWKHSKEVSQRRPVAAEESK